MFDEVTGLQLGHRLTQLLLRVHDDWAIPRYRFLDRLTRHQQEPDTLIAGLNGDFVSAVEKHQRVIAYLVLGLRVRIHGRFGENRARIRRVSKRSRAGKNVGKSVTSGLDPEPLSLPWSNRDIQVIRIRGNAFNRAFLTPKLAAYDAHA